MKPTPIYFSKYIIAVVIPCYRVETLDRGTVVFVEVKTRTGAGHGSPLEAVDGRKQRQLQRAAQYYLATHRLVCRDARFDVVGVCWDAGAARCELVRNAFDAA